MHNGFVFVNIENDNFQTKQNPFVRDFKSKKKNIFSVIVIKKIGFHLFILFHS